MRRHWARNIFWILAGLLLLSAAAPLLVTLNRWQEEITGALSRELGRPVRASGIRLKLLDGPGFEMENVVVSEDPRFGIEPFARMEALRATLRLGPLWRRRVEFSSIELVRPSINAVRNGQGDWNLESLGTGSPGVSGETLPDSAETRGDESPLSLPKIRMDSGRINFKTGDQKTVYVVDPLDLELLPPSARTRPWRLRFEGTPNRTDSPLRSVSSIRGEAEFGLLDSEIREETGTPLRLTLAADGAMLADLLRVFTGDDRGLHGSIRMEIRLAGTTSLLRLTGSAELRDLHRWDLLPPPAAATMKAEFAGILDVESQSLQLESFRIPLAEGSVEVAGTIRDLFHDLRPDLRVAVEQVAVASVADIARQFTAPLDPRWAASGILDGQFQMEGPDYRLKGSVTVSEGQVEETGTPRKARLSPFQAAFEGRGGRLGPVKVHLGDGEALEASLRWDLRKQETRVLLRGESVPLVPFLEWARRLETGWGDADFSEGILSLRMDVVARKGAPPRVTGWAEVSDAVLHSAAVSEPVQIASARLQLRPGEIRVEPLAASIGEMNLAGRLRAQRQPKAPWEFALRASQVDLARLPQLFQKKEARRGPFALFQGNGGEPSRFFDDLAARGTLRADVALYGGTKIENLSASMDYHDRLLDIDSFSGELAGGTQTGTASLRFVPDDPSFTLESSFTNLDLTELTQGSAAWGGYFSGSLSGSLRLAGSGESFQEIVDHLGGSGEAAGRNVTIRGLELAGSPGDGFPAPTDRVVSLSSKFRVAEREVLLTNATLLMAEGASLALSGAVGFDRSLDLTVKKGDQEFHWAGTLAEPRVTETAAFLQPPQD